MSKNIHHSSEIDRIFNILDPQLVNKWLERIKRGFLHTTILKIFGTPNNENTFPILSGSEIIKIIQTKSIDHWKPSPGSLYPILNEMEKDDIIKRNENIDKKAKIYQITNIGVSLLTLVINSSLLLTHQKELLDPEMPEETLHKLFFQEHKDKNIGELISIQKFYLYLANFAGEMIERKDKLEKS